MKKIWFLSLTIFLSISNANAQYKTVAVTPAQVNINPANVIITPENPLSVKDSALRDEVAKWCIEQLRSKDYKKIKAHPSADIFPGIFTRHHKA